MPMAHSSKSAKPEKPYPDFPLFPHATKRWAKKIRGKLHYFGGWSDPHGALEKYLREKDYLHAGLTPPDTCGGLTLHELCNWFMESKQRRLESGDLRQSTLNDYQSTCVRLLKEFGKERFVADIRPIDFERLHASLAKSYGPVRLGNTIVRVRSVFKYAFAAELIEKPVNFGEYFKPPSPAKRRAHRQAKGAKFFEAKQLRRMLKTADLQLRCMMLLAINAGLGNEDCGKLPLSAIDFRTGWLDYPRPKTATERRVPLWPETIALLQQWLAKRPQPKEAAAKQLVFVTKYGHSWSKPADDNPIAKQTRKLLDSLNLHRPGLGFYSIRHAFATIASGTRDQVAVNYCMGHTDSSVPGMYREHIDDQRLIDCVNHVRRWLRLDDQRVVRVLGLASEGGAK
jgi:integrase